ncbi:MAG: FAD-dependent thymidylate synthase [Clostridia bacterium]|nr:FAD-dependent thymidylate synthase [Clostridia bacterium]MBR6810434.1 FAD-dependent thymidylate synthase [Clostridia bacterium]
MPSVPLKVSLIAHTPDPEKTCALAARTCYSGLDMETLKSRVDEKDQADFLRRVVGSGHLSVLEHASFTFSVEGVSRALLAQVTRHRIASFSVQSQRYVSLEKGFGYIIPPKIQTLGAVAVRKYEEQMNTMHKWYVEWQKMLGIGEGSNEDARFVLPNACETHITMTMNARELLHFFSLRCCYRAQWEIRAMAMEMLIHCKRVAPVIFENAGPSCVLGPCPEGEKTCGMDVVNRDYFKSL